MARAFAYLLKEGAPFIHARRKKHEPVLERFYSIPHIKDSKQGPTISTED